MNKREIGSHQEALAEAYLEKMGMRIVARNFRCRLGEIDLIGYHEGYLTFVEVKYRRTNRVGYPDEAVDHRKQRQICKVADYYRLTHGIGNFAGIRYDVVAICGEEIRWLQNAFEHVYS